MLLTKGNSYKTMAAIWRQQRLTYHSSRSDERDRFADDTWTGSHFTGRLISDVRFEARLAQKMGQIGDFLRSDSCSFWLTEPK